MKQASNVQKSIRTFLIGKHQKPANKDGPVQMWKRKRIWMTPISNQTFLSEKYSWKIVDCVVHYFVFTIFTCIISVSISCTNTFLIASHILPRSLYHTIMIVWNYSGTGRVFMYSQKKPSISQPSLIITISRPSSNIQWGCWGYILRLMLSAARNNSLRHQWTFHLPRCHCWLTSKDIMLPVHKWVL